MVLNMIGNGRVLYKEHLKKIRDTIREENR